LMLILLCGLNPVHSQADEWIPPFDEAVVTHVRAIYRDGMRQGNQAMTFIKIGDSITASTNYLYAIGEGVYTLTEDTAQLQSIIRYFSLIEVSAGRNSFTQDSAATGVGWAAFAVFDSTLSNPAYCLPSETPIVCEFRRVRPAYALIGFGTNDVNYRTTTDFHQDIVRIVDYCITNGTIPILITMPPQPNAWGNVTTFNAILQEIAEDYAIPLIDYHGAMLNLPASGLTYDALHPSSPPQGHESTAIFDSANLRYGYVVRNLLTLQMLDAVVRTVLMG
jgi:lysophospholipase L1-like esterase